jgi:hypothetical protein
MAQKRRKAGNGSGVGLARNRAAVGQPAGDSGLFEGSEPPPANPTPLEAATTTNGGGAGRHGDGVPWLPEERAAKLAALNVKLLEIDHGDGATFERIGRALALYVEYTELRDGGLPAADVCAAIERAAAAWSDVSSGVWFDVIQWRRKAGRK